MKKKAKPKVIRRMIAGIRVLPGTRTSAPLCYLIYEVWYDDTSTKFERGQTLYGAAFHIVNNKVPKNEQAGLYRIIEAAGQLANLLEEVCLDLDKVKL
jgi:hypothetical protein